MNNTTSNAVLKVLPSQQEPLVRVNIKYPLSGNEKIDAYIKRIVNALEKFAQTRLVPRCRKGGGKEPFSMVTTYYITLDTDSFFCFYFDTFVWQGEGKSEIKRVPLNFDKLTSNLIFPLEKCHKRELMGRLETSLSKINVSSIFYADNIKRARKYFKKTNAVIASDGIYVTYNSGILAPHKAGAMKIFLIRISNIH